MPEPVIIKVGADLSELSAKLDSLQSQFDEFRGAAKQAGDSTKQAFTGSVQSTDKLTEAVRLLNQQLSHTKDPARKAELQQQIKALEQKTKISPNQKQLYNHTYRAYQNRFKQARLEMP